MTRALPGQALEFLTKALASDTDECIIWPYALFYKGYAHIGIDGKSYRVHRLVCTKVHGPCPDGHEAAHSCGARACINPRHVSWKTGIENAADKAKHGTECFGEKHGQAKLTWEIVAQIRNLKGKCSQRAIAAQFEITQTTVCRIQQRKIWKERLGVDVTSDPL